MSGVDTDVRVSFAKLVAAYMPLRARDGSVRAYAAIDGVDIAQARHRWCLRSDGYVVRRKPGGTGTLLRLHREIMDAPTGLEVDHWNGDTLDNRRHNLRLKTHAENGQNQRSTRGSSSRFRGVGRDGSRWSAKVSLGGVTHNLGRFDDELQAAEVARAFRAKHMPHANEERHAVPA